MKQNSAAAQALASPICSTLLVLDEKQPTFLALGAAVIFRVANSNPPSYRVFFLADGVRWMTLN